MDLDAAIPLRAAWSSPFVRWQGSLADLDSIDLATQVATDGLARARVDPDQLDGLVLGISVPQHRSFYGGPTLAARLGAPGISGPMLSQACATSVACIAAAAQRSTLGGDTVLVVTTDRTSNGPVLAHPTPRRTGGAPVLEHWVLDNFEQDPWGGTSMLQTAENVAARAGIGRAELDDATVLRHRQYRDALAHDRAFQQTWMVPVRVPRRGGEPLIVDTDAGIHETTPEGLADLSPVQPDGVVTFGTQTHPADGTAGMVVTTAATARTMSGGRGVARILGWGTARVEKAHMPEAPVPAAARALEAAGLTFSDVSAVKSHNPFAVNDLWFAKQTGVPLEQANAFGCSLVYGHPQAPTGARGIVELVAELEARGGGIGLFTGCAAGDTGAAVVVEVTD